MFIKPFPKITSPLFKYQSCWERVWLFIKQCPQITWPICKFPSINNGDKEESSTLLVGTSSSHVYSGNDFLLLPGHDGGLDGVLFDSRHKEEPLDYYVNINFLLFEGLLL